MNRLFWIVLAAVTAVTVHIAYTLFVPSNRFGTKLDVVLKDQGSNSFSVIDPVLQSGLLPYATATDLVGLCKFDVGNGKVNLSVTVPNGYWTFAIYTMRGRQIYAINDKQADSQKFTVHMSLAPNLLSQIAGLGEEEPQTSEGDLGWRVAVVERQGLAVLWMPQGDPLMRDEAAKVLKQSSCTAVK